MRKTWKKIVSVLMALTFVVLGLPVFDTPVKSAKAAETPTTKTIYVRTNSMTNNGKYLIVARGTAGDSFALSHNGTQASTDAVTVHAASEEPAAGEVFINASDVDEASIWSAETVNDNMLLSNGSYYLQVTGQQGSSTLVITEGEYSVGDYSNFNWRYGTSNGSTANHLHVTYYNENREYTSTRYIRYYNNAFVGTNNANNDNVFVYEERVICLDHHPVFQNMTWSTRWGVDGLQVFAVATFKCNSCGKTVEVDATVVQGDDVPGTCTKAPEWSYTATVNDIENPSETHSVSKTFIAQESDDTDLIDGTAYVLVDTPTANKNYLIVNTNQVGAAHALANGYPNAGPNAGYDVKDLPVTIKSGSINISGTASTKTYIANWNNAAVWKYTGNGNTRYFQNNGNYLYHHHSQTASDSYIYVDDDSSESNYRSWRVGGTNIRYQGGSGNNYYITYNANNTTNPWRSLPRQNSNVYFFEETTVKVPKNSDATALGHQTPLKPVAEKPETCDEDGSIAHYECERCHKLFDSETGGQELTADQIKIPAAHDWQFTEIEWVGSDAAGYTKALFKYECSRSAEHTINPIEVTVTSQDVAATETECAKTVYTANISSDDSYDGQAYTKTKTVNKYLIKFVNGGTELQSGLVVEGVTPVYNGVTPTKGTDAQYTYTFSGWDPEVVAATADATYTAQFTTSTNSYVVTWVVDGTTTTTNVEYGYPAVYGSTPTKADEGDVTFEFAGWQVTGGDTVYGATEQLPNVTGPDVSYTALFTAYYPITFGEIIEGSMSVEGGDPSDPRAAEGTLITLTLTPTEGYQYHDDSIKVMCGNTKVDAYQINDNQFEFTMPAGSVEVTAVCECFYNVWVNGKQISSLTASNVLQDYDTEGNEVPRMTYSETSEKMVLTILTSDEIKLDNPDPDGSRVMIEIQDTDLGRPFEVVAPADGFNLVSDTAAYGIYSLSSDIIITGDGELTGSTGEFYGIGSWFDFSITINGKMTINSSSDSEEGFGLFTGGDITINDDITIVGGGAQAIYSLGGGDITITAANVNVSGGYSYGIGTFGDGTVLIQGKDGGKATVAISTKGNALSGGAGITITGDVSVTSEYLDFENAIVTDGDCTIDGDFTLDIGGNGNGIYAEGDITITGDVIATDSYDGEDGGVLLYGSDEITVGGSFKASNPSGDLISTMGDISITGDIAGIEDDQPAVAKRGITAFEGTVTVNGNVLMETLAELESAIVAKNLTVDGDFDLTCVGSGIFTNGDVVLGGNVTIVNSSEESAIGINAIGTITMVEGIWDIQLKKGDALSAGIDIIIPDTHGVSVPENGEIGYYENEAMGCYTVVVDGNGGCNTVRIEPFVPVTFVNDDGTKLQTVKGYPGQSPKYTGEKPTKASTADKVYTFKGWKDAAGEYGKDEDLPEIADGSDALTYTAVFEEATEVYTITFVNEDGTELQSGKVAYGETPKYDGATPTKASDDKYDYTFDGWTPEIVKVTGEATYKATYKATEIKKDPVKGVYKYVSEGAPKYTKGSNKSVVITFKRTENDEITFDMFKGIKTAKGELISGKHYTAKKGSVEITILPEYLETLEVGKTAVTISFEDGDPVTIELEVVAAQQQTDTNPTTGDQMNYIWIFFVIGAAALAIVLFVQVQRRRREEEI